MSENADTEKKYTPTESALNQIALERRRQLGKWGEQNWEPLAWYAILGEEFGEVGKALCEHYTLPEGHPKRVSLTEVRDELIQTAAVCVAMLESLERNQGIEI